MSGVLDNLIPAAYNSVQFPCQSVKTDGGHNIVEHKRVDRDGVVIENTGRKPNAYAITIPWLNGLETGNGESWPSSLYPDQYALFLAQIEDRSPGTLTHPEFGDRLVAPVTWSTDLAPGQRGGVIMSVQFIETVEVNEELRPTASNGFAFSSAASSASGLVASYPPAETIAEDQGGLTSFVQSLQGLKGRAAVASSTAFGRIDSVLYQVSSLLTAPDLTSEARIAANRLFSALNSIKQESFNLDKLTAYYTVPAPCHISQVALRTTNSVDQIYELNPKAGSFFTTGDRVRYYDI